ncbi:MAG: hypothetical protein QXY74_05635, partial [Candidatus Bathyarchaeia archaeon]
NCPRQIRSFSKLMSPCIECLRLLKTEYLSWNIFSYAPIRKYTRYLKLECKIYLYLEYVLIKTTAYCPNWCPKFG